MPQSDFLYTITAGTRRGVNYIIGVRVDPNINNVESFATVLFFELGDSTRVQVCKVDNSKHEDKEEIHIDRYYREKGAEIKEFDTKISSWDEGEDYLRKNWRRFADTYYDNHGREPREDAKNI